MPIKVFISWSGPQAKHMAESLKDWLPRVIQDAAPFVSSVDIDRGDRPLPKIAAELEGSSFGIVCVTRENSLKPWINFEAGALSKTIGDARVVPLLLDLPVSDLTGPLKQFQAVSSTSETQMLEMMKSLRDHASLTFLDNDRLKDSFNAFYSRIENALRVARDMPSDAAATTPARAQGDVLEEVLVLARRQESVLRTLVERVDSSVPMTVLRDPLASTAGKADSRREVIDELIAHLALPDERALTYRINTDRTPEDLLVGYDAGTIDSDNAEAVRAQVEDFVRRRGVHVTVRSSDGFQIIASPGRETVVLTPVEPPESAGVLTADGYVTHTVTHTGAADEQPDESDRAGTAASSAPPSQ
ncbi:toll/interleukin-1 receptor domain-containing protein [Streptomyces tendae]|uniref:toll/interleukin-1 receptor domain-containing protein n=1 Tax=Streptomyces tendae TaxID=1932 RepID=UPI0033A56397